MAGLVGLVAGLALLCLHPLAGPALPLAWLLLAGLSAAVPRWGVACGLALVPVAGLGVWTGWRHLDEFDLILSAWLVGLNGHVLLRRRSAHAPRLRPGWRPAVAWAWAAWGLACILAMRQALQASGGEAIDGLWGGHDNAANAWRLLKPWFWLLLMLPALGQLWREGAETLSRALCAGMAWGGAVLCLLLLQERASQVGLFDFQHPYRTTAWFWEMHLGGGAIDFYLAAVLPFAWWAHHEARTRLGWWATAALLAGLVYGVVTTYSRGILLVGVGVSLVMVSGWVRRSAPAPAVRSGWRRTVWVALLIEGLGLWVGSRFAGDRLLEAPQDLLGRLAHWQAIWELPQDAQQRWLGLGLGRIPGRYVARVPGREAAGSARWQPSGDGMAPRLVLVGPLTRSDLAGDFVVMQRLRASWQQVQQVTVTARSKQSVVLQVAVCQRHLLYPLHCSQQSAAWSPSGGAVTRTLVLPEQPSPEAASGPGALGLSLLTSGAELEVLHVRLGTASGAQLPLDNADFGRGLTHWWPVLNRHFQPWHTDNLYLEVAVERGVFGALAALGLAVAVCVGLWQQTRRALRSDQRACAVALLSMGVLGLVISALEFTRTGFLVMFVLCWASFLGGGGRYSSS